MDTTEDLICAALNSARELGYEADSIVFVYYPEDEMPVVAWFVADDENGDAIHVDIGEGEEGHPSLRDAVLHLLRCLVDTEEDASGGMN